MNYFLRLYYIGIFFLMTACAGMFYHPTQELHYDPEVNFKIAPTKYTLDLAGEKIRAWEFKTTQKSKGHILFFHGNAENLSSHYVSLMWVLEKGYDFTIFDYPGYGSSSGTPSPKINLQVGVEIAHWLYNKTQKPIIIYGHSLGGNVALSTAIQLKNKIPIKAVIADSSFDSYPDIAQEKMSDIWIAWPFQWIPQLTLNDNFSPKDLASLSPTPVFYIHCDTDLAVKSHYSKDMYQRSLEPKKLLIIPVCEHGATFFVENGKYRQTFLEFLEQVP